MLVPLLLLLLLLLLPVPVPVLVLVAGGWWLVAGGWWLGISGSKFTAALLAAAPATLRQDKGVDACIGHPGVRACSGDVYACCMLCCQQQHCCCICT